MNIDEERDLERPAAKFLAALIVVAGLAITALSGQFRPIWLSRHPDLARAALVIVIVFLGFGLASKRLWGRPFSSGDRFTMLRETWDVLDRYALWLLSACGLLTLFGAKLSANWPWAFWLVCLLIFVFEVVPDMVAWLSYRP